MRIVQEALTNAAQHANAYQVFVQLKSSTDQVQLWIEDDGQGFDTSIIPENRFGLVGLNERTKLLGGNFYLESHSGSGTRLQITIPLIVQADNSDDE